MVSNIKRKPLTQDFQSLKTKWLDFLIFTNNSDRNKSLVFEYFANEFAYRPRRFYSFVHLLYSYLKTTRNEDTKLVIAKLEEFYKVPGASTLNLTKQLVRPKTYELEEHFEMTSRLMWNSIIDD